MEWFKWLALFVAAGTGIAPLGKISEEFIARADIPGKSAGHNLTTNITILAVLGLMLGMVFGGVTR